MKQILVLGLVILNLHVMAQGNLLGSPAGQVLRSSSSERIEGSKYLFESFEKGTIYDRFGKKEEGLLRFDISENAVQVLIDNDQSIFLTNTQYPRVYTEFYNSKKQLIEKYDFRNGFSVAGFKNGFYFQVIYESKEFSIIKSNEALYKEVPETDYGGQGSVKGYYHKNFKYFYSNDSEVFNSFKPSKKALINIMPDKASDINKTAKRLRTNFKDDFELQEFLQELLK